MSLHPRAIATEWILKNYPQLFDAQVSRLLNSPNAEERDLIFLGFTADGSHGVYVPWMDLLRHAHILGDPGSGKTAKWLVPVASQLIAGGHVSVVILDLKGDMAQFQNAKAEAESAGVPFKYFTTQLGLSSYVWNFFAEPFLNRLSLEQIAQTIIVGCGLDHAEIYGGGHFTAAMKMFLVNILERYWDSIHSFADLYRYCSDPQAYKGLGAKEDPKDARHFINVLRMLAGPLPFNATAGTLRADSGTLQRAMTVEELFEGPAVYYFWLPATVDSSQATCITRLFLFAQVVAAAVYQLMRKTRPCINVVDEAQLIATQGLPLILNQARSLKIGCVLAHQSLDQLKLSSDNDLTQIVLSSTGIKHVFRASDLLIRDYLTKTGGEALYHQLNWRQAIPIGGEIGEAALCPQAAVDGVVNVAEQAGPRIEPNRLMEISANPHLSLVNFTEDHGPVQYRGVWTPTLMGFHIDAETYKRRMAAPWPPADEDGGTIVVPRNWTPGPLPPRSAPAPAPTNTLQDRLQQALQARRPQQGQ